MIREVWRSQPPRAWLADIIGMAAIAGICAAFVIVGLAVIPG